MKSGGRPGGRVAACIACLSLLLSSPPPSWLSAPVSVSALSCLPCERSRCEHNLRCPGHTVTAPCGCCEECARQLGEPCGGPFGIVGQCDLGLRCLVVSSPPPPPPPGDTAHASNASASSYSLSMDPAAQRNWNGDEVGICKAAEEDYADDEYLAMEPCLEELVTGCNLRAGQCVCEEARTCGNPFSFADLDACAQALRRIEDEKPDCSGVRCVVQFSPRCPDDSVLIEGFAPPGLCCPLPSRCECRPAGCVRRACPSDSQATLMRKATGRPGECCNVYDCKRTFDSDCRGVECPPVLDVSCPLDSQPTPGKLTRDGCCVQPDSLRCVCGPSECSKPECEAGTVARLLIRGDGTPGQCCDVYECVKGTGRTCAFSGVELADGETYRLDACRFCRCRAGVSFCFAAQCGELRCQRYYTPPGECCPVCEDAMTAPSNPAGCFAAGEIRAHGARWREDDCTFCRCVDGEPQCTATACGQSCLHPVKIPGECCPVCEEPTLITVVPPVCRAVGNCSLRDSDCAHGFRLDSHGCRLCQCKTKAEACAGLMVGCTLDCPFGFVLDDASGCESCQCRAKARKCRPTACDKHCPYGYMTNKQGCEACRCMKCPPSACTKQCLFGFQHNSKGCQVCKCKDSPVLPSPTLPPLRPGSCLLMDGRRRSDGEAWHDGCRECYCHSGREMCSLIACPAPVCTNPTLKPGRCCPSCHDGSDEDEADPSEEAAVCHSPGGQSYVEGETWPMDACTQCACHGGRVLCDSEVCPPLLCASPVRTPDSCCPHCPEDGESHPGGAAGNDSVTAYCRSEEGDMFLPWEAWKPDVCTSCMCRNGHIACFHESCPALPCPRPVLRKGQCCPYCLDEPPFSTGCSFDGRLYGDGERWALDSCTHCFCVGSQTLCAMDDCPTLTCAQPLFLEGLCCPLCPDEPTVAAVTVPVNKADRWNEIDPDNAATLPTTPVLEETHDLENHIPGAHLRLAPADPSHASRSQDLAWLALVPLVAVVAIGAALLYQHRHKRWIPSPAYKPPGKESCFSPELQTHSVVYVDCERGTKVQVDSPHRMKRLADEDTRYSGCFSTPNGHAGGGGVATQAGAQCTDAL
ncbi:cysteine-rich motor neuron 1 protein isoform X1 [Lampetra fluviatilis]